MLQPGQEGRVVAIRVAIERHVDDGFPGWVECSFVDVAGHRHVFEEKVPIVTAAALDARSDYPAQGEIAGTVTGVELAADGRQIVTVHTEKPWGIASSRGEQSFRVFGEQLVAIDMGGN